MKSDNATWRGPALPKRVKQSIVNKILRTVRKRRQKPQPIENGKFTHRVGRGDRQVNLTVTWAYTRDPESLTVTIKR
jgi:hypothetical protein